MKRKILGFIVLVITLVMCFTSCTDEEKLMIADNTKMLTTTVSESAIQFNGVILTGVKKKEFSYYEIKRIDAGYDAAYPNAKRLRSASAKYNCHSYAWYSTSANNEYWIDDPKPMWAKGGLYIEVLSTTDTNNIKRTTQGTHVVYFEKGEEQHSALVKNSSKVTSKWGSAGLYEHSLHDCPYFITGVKGAINCDTIKYYEHK